MKKYLLAVSGGVDSVLMLDEMVRKHDAKDLLVMHFDHGMREASWHDASFVEGLAGKYGVDFVSETGNLGAVSESVARKARWEFFRRLQSEHQGSICTAHHQDDVLETMLMNLQRGTGWRGLISLRESDKVERPLLGLGKAQIRDLAVELRLEWCEDETNQSLDYTRNRVRHQIVSRLTSSQREQLLEINSRLLEIVPDIESSLQALSGSVAESTSTTIKLHRAKFAELPQNLKQESLVYLVRKISQNQKNFTSDHWVAAARFIVSKPSGKEMQLPSGLRIYNRSKAETEIVQT